LRRRWQTWVVTVLVLGALAGAAVWWNDSGPANERVTAKANASRWPQSTLAMRSPGRLRVLFIGNSFTFYNGGQALILEQLSRSAKKTPPPVFDQVCVFGATWEELWRYSKAVPMIRQGGWDYVILQDYSLAAVKYRDEMDQYGRMWSKEIRAVGGTPIFFMTWARKDYPDMLPQIAGAYTAVASANHAPVAPVGLAWAAALHGRPTLGLHMKDRRHPTPAGSYLTACVFYSMLFHESPHGLTRRISEGSNVYISLSASDATYLQDVAWKTVLAEGKLASTRPTTRPGMGTSK
jgi:hypothetical protein